MSPLATQDPSPVFQRDRQPSPRPGKPTNLLRWFLLAAILILCISGASRLLNSTKPATSVSVLAAGQDLPAGCKLGYTSVHFTQIPAAYLTAEMFTSSSQVVGRPTRYFIRKGEPLTKSALLANADEPALMLAKGLRGITLELDPAAVVDNLIYPGDRVDVLAVVLHNNKRFTRTICQNLQVLFCGTREALLADRNRPAAEGNRVTLAALPDDCERLSQAQALGKLRLVMRSRGDFQTAPLSGAGEDDVLPAFAQNKLEPVVTAGAREALAAQQSMLSAPPPPPLPAAPIPAAESPAAPAAPLAWVVEMFSGSKKESYEVQGR